MIKDCRLGYELGFDCAWVLEHHFTDYFPTPSPLILMSHLAAAFPGLSLGSCVLVVPWYNPLRLAEEISMLSHLCAGELHLAFGRGTAKLEYDAYDIDMSSAKDRFKEAITLIDKGSLVKPLNIAESTIMLVGGLRLDRPNREKIFFYGAVGSRESAAGNADMGMPILLIPIPPHMLKKVTEGWQERADHIGLSAPETDQFRRTVSWLIVTKRQGRQLEVTWLNFLNFRQIITKQTQTTGKVLRDTSNFPRLLVI